jgi:hypothetical protein
MRKVSIIGKDYSLEEHVVGFYNGPERAKFFGKLGAFWGGLFGMLFGAAFLFFPVVGHIVILGPLAAVVAGGLEGAVIVGGLSALAGALSAIGIPRNSVLRYERDIRAGKFMLVVHGEAKDIERAREILTRTRLATFANTQATAH